MHQVSFEITLLFSVLLAAMVAALAFEEKIHAKKSLITGSFAIISVLLADILHILPIGAVTNVFGESLHIPVYITGIDWEVIAIIVGASLFVDVSSRSGLFTWIALTLTKASRGDPLKLLWYYGGLTVVFSAFLNNVTAMIIVGSLTGVSLTRLNRSSLLLGFLLVEGLLTNVGGLLTLISSVPNIIIGNAAGITFVSFFLASAPYVLAASVLTLFMGAHLFEIPSLATVDEQNAAAEMIEGFDEGASIPSPAFFRLCAVCFVLLIALFASTSYLPYLSELGLGFVAMTFGVFMLWSYKKEVDQFYKGLDWDLIFFFMTLFVVINVMEHAKVLELIGHGIKHVIDLGAVAGGAGLLWCSALASAVTDNIPLAAVLAKVLELQGTSGDSPLWWSVIFGANLGGNITPIGSASTVVAVTVMHKHKIKLSFLGFVKLAAVFAAVQLAVATGYVLLFLS